MVGSCLGAFPLERAVAYGHGVTGRPMPGLPVLSPDFTPVWRLRISQLSCAIRQMDVAWSAIQACRAPILSGVHSALSRASALVMANTLSR